MFSRRLLQAGRRGARPVQISARHAQICPKTDAKSQITVKDELRKMRHDVTEELKEIRIKLNGALSHIIQIELKVESAEKRADDPSGVLFAFMCGFGFHWFAC